MAGGQNYLGTCHSSEVRQQLESVMSEVDVKSQSPSRKLILSFSAAFSHCLTCPSLFSSPASFFLTLSFPFFFPLSLPLSLFSLISTKSRAPLNS